MWGQQRGESTNEEIIAPCSLIHRIGWRDCRTGEFQGYHRTSWVCLECSLPVSSYFIESSIIRVFVCYYCTTKGKRPQQIWTVLSLQRALAGGDLFLYEKASLFYCLSFRPRKAFLWQLRSIDSVPYHFLNVHVC